MRLRRLSALPPWEIIVYALAALLLLGGLFSLLFNYIRPAPPRHIVMVTGSPGGAYAHFGERYREALAQYGIALELRETSGSVENLKTIKTDCSVDLAFVQGGITADPNSEDLITLGSMYVEPLWIFYRSDRLRTRLTDLNDLKVAVGAPGSGTQLLAYQVLAATGIPTDAGNLVSLDTRTTVDALVAGEIQGAIMVAAPEAPILQQLFHHPTIQLMNLVHAEAYARRFPHLSHYVLPAGGLDLVRPFPAIDVNLLATTATLVARKDIHPAIVSLMLQAAKEIHGGPGLLQKNGEFPALRDHGLPASPVARRYYESGPPLLQRYLPFWAAILAERLIIAILPLLALFLPLSRALPALYTWRVRARIYRWYGELKTLEKEIQGSPSGTNGAEWLIRLNRIEQRASSKRIPLSHAHELYTLKEHIELVRHLAATRMGQELNK
ncbi:MAG: ABC transporter substrate-binding protein [Zoogloeaceae bacterium]|nr:ABC transporter substrate-binding protein [Zoogloeaceae bacterium]